MCCCYISSSLTQLISSSDETCDWGMKTELWVQIQINIWESWAPTWIRWRSDAQDSLSFVIGCWRSACSRSTWLNMWSETQVTEVWSAERLLVLAVSTCRFLSGSFESHVDVKRAAEELKLLHTESVFMTESEEIRENTSDGAEILPSLHANEAFFVHVERKLDGENPSSALSRQTETWWTSTTWTEEETRKLWACLNHEAMHILFFHFC